jgi:PAS domain S-box-containing protein
MSIKNEDQMINSQHQNSRLKAMFKTVFDGIVTIDNKGVIESFNDSPEKFTGY